MATTTQQSTRRVLGDLGVNNSNTSTKLQSPKTAKAVASLEVPAPSLALSPGKKRSIHEVDGAASTTGEARSGAMGRFEALEQAAKKSRSSDKEVINILSDDDSVCSRHLRWTDFVLTNGCHRILRALYMTIMLSHQLNKI